MSKQPGARPHRGATEPPTGRLADGTFYYGQIGEMAHDEDRVQCHLCGKWFKWVGGAHLTQGHAWTLDQYREAFALLRTTTTAAPATSDRKRSTMLEQFATGRRVIPDREEVKRRRAQRQPTVARWRSLAAARPHLAAELHPTRNGDLDPFTVGPHSHRKLWWRGSDCGHEWEAAPNQRTSAGRGCSICGRQRSILAAVARSQQPLAAERSLAALYPELLAEWHPILNGDLDPRTIAPGTDRRIWWRCVTCGHEWAAAGNDRTRTHREPHGCPACGRARQRQAMLAVASREQSVVARRPDLVAEWHPTRNGDLDPFSVKPASEQKIWWRCADCATEWQATPGSRSRSPHGGCRRCATSRAQRQRWANARTTPPQRHQATGIAGRRLRGLLAEQGVAVIGLACPSPGRCRQAPPFGIPARREVALVAEARVLTGEESPVAVNQSLRLGGRGVELAAGGLVGGVIGVQQFRRAPQPHRGVAVGDPEREPLVDVLGERAGALAPGGARLGAVEVILTQIVGVGAHAFGQLVKARDVIGQPCSGPC
jgi:hypothetical protein